MKRTGGLSSGLADLIYNKSAFYLALPGAAVRELMRWMNRTVKWMDWQDYALVESRKGMEC